MTDGNDYISALKNILQIEAVSYNPTVFKEDKQSNPGAERSRILSGYHWIL